MKKHIFIFSIFLVYLSCSADKVVNDNEAKDPLYNMFTFLSPEESGIDFKNELRDSALFFVMNYEYAYNGSGVAIGDINNDGLQDVYLNSNYDSGKLFLNLGDFKFRNITLQAGVTGGIGLKTGVCMVDLNGDGFLDIYITKSGRFKEEDVRKNVLYINNGDLTFHEAAHEFGLDDMSYGTQAYFADIDVDGDLDAYLVNHPVGWGKQDQLNIDIDDQGKYYIVQDTQRQFISDRLLINENGKFIDKSVQYGIDNVAFGLSAFFGDLIMTITLICMYAMII
ncbi:MAG: VCBS repeat-containing protein [Saprospiraceae bacterium]|nr:VCBS repeat-containing protein [Saprospiraceae bacterium]